jgi:hypothetical protein
MPHDFHRRLIEPKEADHVDHIKSARFRGRLIKSRAGFPWIYLEKIISLSLANA